MFRINLACAFVVALAALPLAAQDKPFPAGEAAAHDSAARLQRDPVRRRARSRPADRHSPSTIAADFGSSNAIPIRTGQGRREGRDRVLIFEDTKGDGQFDKRTVFCGQRHEPVRHRRSVSAAFGSARRRTCCSSRSRHGEDQPAGRRKSCSTAGTSRKPGTMSSTA